MIKRIVIIGTCIIFFLISCSSNDMFYSTSTLSKKGNSMTFEGNKSSDINEETTTETNEDDNLFDYEPDNIGNEDLNTNPPSPPIRDDEDDFSNNNETNNSDSGSPNLIECGSSSGQPKYYMCHRAPPRSCHSVPNSHIAITLCLPMPAIENHMKRHPHDTYGKCK